jgi:prepilin-type N-terminal cleavage/methylation domain-containing protein
MQLMSTREAVRSARRHDAHRAFTLVELLVVIAIIGVLVSLLLPAVQAAREAARRSQCTNQLRQLGLALINHHDVRGRFPSASIRSYANDTTGQATSDFYGPQQSWIAQILPFIEEMNIYSGIDFNEFQGARNDVVRRQTPLPLIRCPSDGTSQPGDSTDAPTNYVACYGSSSSESCTPPGIGDCEPRQLGRVFSVSGADGIFYNDSKVRYRQITDGLSKTLAVSECLVGSPIQDINSEGLLESCADGVRVASLAQERWRGGSWYYGAQQSYWGFSTFITPNSTTTFGDCRFKPWSSVGVYAAQSSHPGGVSALIADGSCHFVSDDVERAVWSAFGTINRGEVATDL